MKKKAKKAGNMKMYIATVGFSLVWIGIALISPATKEVDYGWDHFIVNLPEKLSLFDFSSKEYSHTFLFGKYINKPSTSTITITAIDDYTLKRYGWPIKRRYYGELVEKLKKLGVKAIGMDVLLFEPDQDNPENDHRYVDAVSKVGNVVNLVSVDLFTWNIKKPLPGLEKASALIAHPNVDITQDSDGQVRRYYPFYPGTDTDFNGKADNFLTYDRAGLKNVKCWKDCKENSLPSLGIATYAIFSGKSLTELQMDYPDEKILNYRYIVSHMSNPGWNKDDKKRTFYSFRHISVRDILEGRLSVEEKEALKGGITFIGSTAIGAFDHVPSPFLKQLPGVEVHATFLDNLIAKDFRSPLSPEYQALLVLILPWVPVLLRRYSLKLLVCTSLGTMAALLAADIVLLTNGTVMPFISMLSAIFLPVAYITVDKGLAEGREKKWIKNTFGQYLSPKIVEVITKDPSKLTLGGEKRDMTAFFLDIAGFTTMSEKMTPEQLTTMLNKYLSGLTDVILKHDGVVDKFIGDCIMAFWNAPLEQKDHRRLACLAAVECTQELNRLNTTLNDSSAKLSFRIGLNSGPMVVGNMGSSTRFSYTVLGDSVNLASRLEGANKFFHSRIMASEYTYEEAKNALEARLLGQIRVVGKAIPVKVYELLAKKGRLDAKMSQVADAYNEGMGHFYKGAYEKARKAFKAALAADPEDGPSVFYLDLAEKYAAESPKDWDGTFNLTSK